MGIVSGSVLYSLLQDNGEFKDFRLFVCNHMKVNAIRYLGNFNKYLDCANE